MCETYETEIERGDDALRIEIQFEYTAGHPGRTNCRVDDSYPPEPPSVDILDVIDEDTGEEVELTYDEERALVTEIHMEMEARAYNGYYDP